MVVKVAMPEQFKLKIVPDIRNFSFQVKEKSIISADRKCFRLRWKQIRKRT